MKLVSTFPLNKLNTLACPRTFNYSLACWEILWHSKFIYNSLDNFLFYINMFFYQLLWALSLANWRIKLSGSLVIFHREIWPKVIYHIIMHIKESTCYIISRIVWWCHHWHVPHSISVKYHCWIVCYRPSIFTCTIFLMSKNSIENISVSLIRNISEIYLLQLKISW